MDPEIQKQMGAMRVMRQQQQNCMAKVQALKQTQKRIELTQKEISTVSLFFDFYRAHDPRRYDSSFFIQSDLTVSSS